MIAIPACLLRFIAGCPERFSCRLFLGYLIAAAFISSCFNRSCCERDNGYKTHRAKRSYPLQAHCKNDDNLEGIRRRKQEAIWQSTFSFPPPLLNRWPHPFFLA